ncbi:nucleotidyltransferase [Breznakiellaceae bacterium SP9]
MEENTMLNSDYKDILLALSEEKVKFILVGAYAVAVHGYPRATMDIDIWVYTSSENAEALIRALERFGAPTGGISKADFETNDLIFQIGVEPRRIAVLTSIDGLNFEDAYSRSKEIIIEGIPLHVLSKEDILTNKRAAGRSKDLADIEMLEGKEKQIIPKL